MLLRAYSVRRLRIGQTQTIQKISSRSNPVIDGMRLQRLGVSYLNCDVDNLSVSCRTQRVRTQRVRLA